MPAGVGEVEEVAGVREDAGAVEELAGDPFLIRRGRAAQEGGPAGFAREDVEAGGPGRNGRPLDRARGRCRRIFGEPLD